MGVYVCVCVLVVMMHMQFNLAIKVYNVITFCCFSIRNKF